MKISVIIPTFNRATVLKKNVQKLVNQNFKDLEIVVVDDGSDVENLKILKTIKKIKLIRINHLGPAAARNKAVKVSTGELLIFINDDTEVLKNFFKFHLEFHNKHKELNKAVFGPFLVRKNKINNAAIYWLVFVSGQHFSYIKAMGGKVPWYYFWTCNISIKRKFIIDNKLFFDESFPTAAWEDIEFAYRAMKKGLILNYDNRIKTYHEHYFGFKEVLERFFSHGRGLYHLNSKLPENFLPPLSSDYIRNFFLILTKITFYKIWKNRLISMLEKYNFAPNWLMQMLVIAQKVEGFDYEKSRVR